MDDDYQPSRAVMVLQSMMAEKLASNEQLEAEIRTISQVAAINGEFTDALKGYEMIGKMRGLLTDKGRAPANAGNHIHFHGDGALEVAREASPEELQARLTELRSVDAVVVPEEDPYE
jgi:hypothetical protein